MFGTTTWPTATTQPHAAPGNDPQAPTGLVRIRVTRRAMRTHRARRDVRMPRIRHTDTYLVRMTRPALSETVPLRPAPAAAPHRLRTAPAVAPHRVRAAPAFAPHRMRAAPAAAPHVLGVAR